MTQRVEGGYTISVGTIETTVRNPDAPLRLEYASTSVTPGEEQQTLKLALILQEILNQESQSEINANDNFRNELTTAQTRRGSVLFDLSVLSSSALRC